MNSSVSLSEEIQRRLKEVLNPSFLEVFDESASHAGHAGARMGGAHIRVNARSSRFEGMAPLARHRLVNDALADLIHSGQIHALSLKLDP